MGWLGAVLHFCLEESEKDVFDHFVVKFGRGGSGRVLAGEAEGECHVVPQTKEVRPERAPGLHQLLILAGQQEQLQVRLLLDSRQVPAGLAL